jgi:hypothetical protein
METGRWPCWSDWRWSRLWSRWPSPASCSPGPAAGARRRTSPSRGHVLRQLRGIPHEPERQPGRDPVPLALRPRWWPQPVRRGCHPSGWRRRRVTDPLDAVTPSRSRPGTISPPCTAPAGTGRRERRRDDVEVRAGPTLTRAPSYAQMIRAVPHVPGVAGDGTTRVSDATSRPASGYGRNRRILTVSPDTRVELLAVATGPDRHGVLTDMRGDPADGTGSPPPSWTRSSPNRRTVRRAPSPPASVSASACSTTGCPDTIHIEAYFG